MEYIIFGFWLCELLILWEFLVLKRSKYITIGDEVDFYLLVLTVCFVRMSVVGKIAEFNPQTEKFSSYFERLELYFIANGVTANKVVPVFLTVIGAKTYSILEHSLAPDKPKDKTLAELKEVLLAHFEPEPLLIAERFHFHKRDQKEGEPLADFVAELRSLASNCQFGAHLDDALRDRFVCGLRNESIQKILLMEKALKFNAAVEKALQLEAAEVNTKAMKFGRSGEGTAVNHKVSQQRERCIHCGKSNHTAIHCRFKEALCHTCNKKGHISTVCRDKGRGRMRGATASAKWVNESIEESDEDLPLFRVTESSAPPILFDVEVNGVIIRMEFDTGASISLISEETYRQYFPLVELSPSKLVLRTYTTEPLKVLGYMQAQVQYENQKATVPLFIIEGKGPSLIGRDWMTKIQFNWNTVKQISAQGRLEALFEKYSSIFSDKLGTMKNYTATLELEQSVKPKFYRPRPVPFAIKDSIELELDSLETAGILKKVLHSKWASPIVAVPKKEGKIRICGDYKVTINPVLNVNKYPLPRSEDLFATLSGGQRFSKIDLSQAYQQMHLDQESRELLTINTHKGLYQYTRLPFGVASAPAIFQQAMDKSGVPGTVCYIDDILVTGRNTEEHLSNLEEVFRRLANEGVTVKNSKCSYLENKVEYLGHVIDSKGIHVDPSKVKAIVKAPAPKNVVQLRSFLGLVNYYGKFIPNLATLTHPLNQLLKKNCKWQWSKACAETFEGIKKLLLTPAVLVHYNSTLPIQLATDASAYGVGAVISHIFPDGSEHPVAFSSRTLSRAERNYSQIEKEALSIVYGIKKFHQYLYGREFVLITDHQPLTSIFGPRKSIPTLAAARLQRWAIILSAYKYHIQYRATQKHANADVLSRLPLPKAEPNYIDYDAVFTLGQIESLPVTARQIAKATSKDVVLSQVAEFTMKGWPKTVPQELKPYYNRRHELSLQGGCLLWGMRVIVPPSYQELILEELHSDHPGIIRMKSMARSHVWWPRIDSKIERVVKSCIVCQSVRSSPPKSPLNPWLWPSKPWSRIHIDFAGPLYGRTYLVVIDAHSKWPEVFSMSSTTTEHTIDALRQLFSHYGLPDQLVSDNGPQFTSREFVMFLKQNGIQHTLTAPYHPASNGLAERFVQTLKRSIISSRSGNRSLQHCLASFLLNYRTTAHAVTGVPPAELFLKRRLKTRLDLVKPDIATAVANQQSSQKKHHDHHSRQRQINAGDLVMVKIFKDNRFHWVPGTIMECYGLVSFLVQIHGGILRRCHIDQIKRREEVHESATGTKDKVRDTDTKGEVTNGKQSKMEESEEANVESGLEIIPPSEATGNDENDFTTNDDVSGRRYPTRVRRPPDRYF